MRADFPHTALQYVSQHRQWSIKFMHNMRQWQRIVSQVIEITFPTPSITLTASIEPFMYHSYHLIIEHFQHSTITTDTILLIAIPLPKGYAHLDRASAPARESTTVKQATLTQAAIESNPKHEPSVYMTLPVHLSSKRIHQIRHRLRLIRHRSHQTDRPIPHRARSNLANSPVLHQ